jgi:hypothetical protein
VKTVGVAAAGCNLTNIITISILWKMETRVSVVTFNSLVFGLCGNPSSRFYLPVITITCLVISFFSIFEYKGMDKYEVKGGKAV